MADVVNVKVNQSIKGNKLSGNSSIRQRFKMRLTVPADIIINVKARNNSSKKPNAQTDNSPVFNNKKETQDAEK